MRGMTESWGSTAMGSGAASIYIREKTRQNEIGERDAKTSALAFDLKGGQSFSQLVVIDPKIAKPLGGGDGLSQTRGVD